MAVDLKNLIDINLLSYFKSKLDLLFANKVDKETGKGLSSNDYTSAEKTKLANIEAQAQVNKLEGIQVSGTTISATNKIVNIPTATQSAAGAMSADDKKKLDGVSTGAQVNVIETVKVNGTSQTVTGKAVDISVPTTVAELTDADDYATKDYVDENGGKIDKIKVNGTEQTIDSSDKSVNIAVPTGGSAAPAMDGTAAAGTAATWAHSDHVHPHDSTKVDKVTGKGLSTNDYTTAEKNKLGAIAENAQVNVIETIKKNGTAITPVDKAVDIAVPTKTSDLNNDSGYITAADIPASVQPSTTTPKMNGTAAVGTETKFARGDHVHPSDSTKVDKEAGKGLSTNDFTDDYKTALETIQNDYVDQAQWSEIIPVHVFQLSIENGDLVLDIGTYDSDHNPTLETLGGFTAALQAGVNFWFCTNSFAEEQVWRIISYVVDDDVAITLACIKANGSVQWATLTPTSTTTMEGHIYTSSSTSNDFTDALKTKLEGIEAGAQVNVVTNASSTGSGAAQTMTVSKGSTNYTTYTKDALDTSLGLKANASSVYTKTEIDQKLVGAMSYKGTKATTSALPASGNAQGDVWHITADGSEWAWNGSAWEELGTALDLSGYVEESEIGLATNDDIDALFA